MKNYSEATINRILDELELKRILEDVRDNDLIPQLKPKYKKLVSNFMMNYSLLEAYWIDTEELQNIDNFCKKFSNYYWSKSKIKEYAIIYASIECIGSSRIDRYGRTPSNEIIQITMFLRDELNICYENINILDTTLNGNQWKNRSDNESNKEYTSFRALMYIIRQIRNNLFHGNKFDLETEQHHRNKILIKTATKIVKLILDELSNAEQNS